MDLINYFGLALVVAIMVPNVIFAVRCKDGFKNLWENRAVEVLEQVGRFGCMGFMVVIIPDIEFGFPSKEAFIAYLAVNCALVLAYWVVWTVCFKKGGVFKALALSILPSAVFFVSGVLSRYWPLVVSAAVFAPCHILISYKNAVLQKMQDASVSQK